MGAARGLDRRSGTCQEGGRSFFSNFLLLTKCLGKMFTNRCPLLPRGKTLKTRRHSYILNSQWVANQNKRYCKIREQLRLTHKLAWGVPYAWERWDRLD